jgi:hypothetical protein
MKTVNNRAMATAVAEAIRTVGGYIHAGCEVHGDVRGLLQTVWDCTENYMPTQGDVAANKRRLFGAPVGSSIVFSTRCRDDEREEETWTKTGPCTWRKVHRWVETRVGGEWERTSL